MFNRQDSRLTELFRGFMSSLVEESRLHRWEKVFKWYSEADHADSVPVNPKERDVVVILGDLGYFSELLFLGRPRPPITFSDQTKLCDWLKQETPLSLTVVAPRTQLSYTTISNIQKACLELHIPLGFLTARDSEGLNFFLCKQLLAQRGLPKLPLASFDVHSGEGWASNPDKLEKLNLDEISDGEWGLLNILGHGDGAHMHLGRAVLCGLVGDVEQIDGNALKDGCSEKNCKKSRHFRLRVLRATDLRCAISSFLSCNSFSVAGQKYLSDISIMLAAADGFSTASIGYLSAASLGKYLAPLLESVAGKPSLGEAILHINLALKKTGDKGDFILLGDPLLHPAFEKAFGESSIKAATKNPLPEQIRLSQEITNSRPDYPPEFILNLMAQALQRIARYEKELLYDSYNNETELIEAIVKLVNYRRQIEQLTVLAWRSVAIQKQELGKSLLTPTIRSNLEKLISRWNEDFANLVEKFLLNTQRSGDEILQLLSRQHEKIFDAVGEDCVSCGTPVEIEWLRSTGFGEIRESISCPLCGPISNHRLGGAMLRLKMLERTMPGLTAKFEVELVKPKSCFNVPSRLIVDLIDKTRPGSVYRTNVLCEDDKGTFDLELPIAEDAGLDIHFVRIIWILDMEVVYIQHSFAVYPA
jgi:hypothetical protein